LLLSSLEQDFSNLEQDSSNLEQDSSNLDQDSLNPHRVLYDLQITWVAVGRCT
jgi:hypothetical protein